MRRMEACLYVAPSDRTVLKRLFTPDKNLPEAIEEELDRTLRALGPP